MPGSYKQLDFAERQQVYFLRKQGLSCRGIARQLGRSPSTISRELRRNSGGRGYRFSQAQRMAWERRSETSSVPRKMTGRMWAISGGQACHAVESRADIGTSQARLGGFGKRGVDIPSRVGGQAQ